MRTIVEPLPHDLAVKAALESIGKPVGWSQAPASALSSSGLPSTDYMVLWRVGAERDGTLNDPYADGGFVYQITSVGRLPDGVSWLAGKIEAALLGATVDDRAVTEVVPLLEQGPFADRDVGPPHPYYGISQYRVRSTPA